MRAALDSAYLSVSDSGEENHNEETKQPVQSLKSQLLAADKKLSTDKTPSALYAGLISHSDEGSDEDDLAEGAAMANHEDSASDKENNDDPDFMASDLPDEYESIETTNKQRRISAPRKNSSSSEKSGEDDQAQIVMIKSMLREKKHAAEALCDESVDKSAFSSIEKKRSELLVLDFDENG